MKRKQWIDLARGFCMMAILLDHTEVYYTGNNIIPYHYYITNALIGFYFISGYLFYKNNYFNYTYKIRSILRTIIKPYFIFTFIISISKTYCLGDENDMFSSLKHIVYGQASWFIAALIVGELIFSTIVYISKSKTWILSTLSIVCFALSIVLSHQHASYPWQINNALQAILFINLGYLYHQFEEYFNRFNTPLYIFLLLLLFIIIKVYEEYDAWNMYISPILIDNYALFIIDTLLFSHLLICLCKQMEKYHSNNKIQQTINDMIAWTGAHSLVYYFLSGGIPLLVSTAMNKINYAYEGNYLRVIITFISVYIITSIFTWIIYRFFPYITGKR